MDKIAYALKVLRLYRYQLRPQQYRTLRGQVLAGDTAGALKGLKKILKRQKPVRAPDGAIYYQDRDGQGWTAYEVDGSGY